MAVLLHVQGSGRDSLRPFGGHAIRTVAWERFDPTSVGVDVETIIISPPDAVTGLDAVTAIRNAGDNHPVLLVPDDSPGWRTVAATRLPGADVVLGGIRSLPDYIPAADYPHESGLWDELDRSDDTREAARVIDLRRHIPRGGSHRLLRQRMGDQPNDIAAAVRDFTAGLTGAGLDNSPATYPPTGPLEPASWLPQQPSDSPAVRDPDVWAPDDRASDVWAPERESEDEVAQLLDQSVAQQSTDPALDTAADVPAGLDVAGSTPDEPDDQASEFTRPELDEAAQPAIAQQPTGTAPETDVATATLLDDRLGRRGHSRGHDEAPLTRGDVASTEVASSEVALTDVAPTGDGPTPRRMARALSDPAVLVPALLEAVDRLEGLTQTATGIAEFISARIPTDAVDVIVADETTWRTVHTAGAATGAGSATHVVDMAGLVTWLDKFDTPVVLDGSDLAAPGSWVLAAAAPAAGSAVVLLCWREPGRPVFDPVSVTTLAEIAADAATSLDLALRIRRLARAMAPHAD